MFVYPVLHICLQTIRSKNIYFDPSDFCSLTVPVQDQAAHRIDLLYFYMAGLLLTQVNGWCFAIALSC